MGKNKQKRQVVRLTTQLEWEDLVLPNHTQDAIAEIIHWANMENELLKNGHLKKWLKPGYRVLFSGPSGTGKTLTASLIGKKLNRPVVKIDLSLLVSKYIGETEKNLQKIFDHSKNKNWILFFDEADALFGKRTNVRDAHDRYANLEVSYLLQRIENFSGLIILASNRKNAIDDSFLRRIQMHIPFNVPNKPERLRLWQRIFSDEFQLEKDLLNKISEDYELTGRAIRNVLQTVVIHKSQNKKKIHSTKDDLLFAIRRELSNQNDE